MDFGKLLHFAVGRFAARYRVGAWKRMRSTEDVVHRAILLNDDHDVLDLPIWSARRVVRDATIGCRDVWEGERLATRAAGGKRECNDNDNVALHSACFLRCCALVLLT